MNAGCWEGAFPSGEAPLTPIAGVWYKCHEPEGGRPVTVEGHTSSRILVGAHDVAERTRMAECLEGAGYCIQQAATGSAVLRAAARRAPGLVLLEVELPGMCGYEVCYRLREDLGDALPIILISRLRQRPFDRVAGLLIGADDYLAEPVDEAELCARARRLIRRARRGHEFASFDLTSREIEVLGLLIDGLGQREVAERLVLSPRTVGTHIEHIFLKLGVHSRAQAVAVAYRNRLLEQPVR